MCIRRLKNNKTPRRNQIELLGGPKILNSVDDSIYKVSLLKMICVVKLLNFAFYKKHGIKEKVKYHEEMKQNVLDGYLDMVIRRNFCEERPE